MSLGMPMVAHGGYGGYSGYGGHIGYGGHGGHGQTATNFIQQEVMG